MWPQPLLCAEVLSLETERKDGFRLVPSRDQIKPWVISISCQSYFCRTGQEIRLLNYSLASRARPFSSFFLQSLYQSQAL